MRRFLRRLHLYLGCLFAPLLLFFTLSGLFQTLQLHADQKNGYRAPTLLKEMAEVHRHQRVGELEEERPASSLSFRYAVALASVGLAVTVVLGIVMAFQTLRTPGRVLLCLLAGTMLPALLLLLGPHERPEPPDEGRPPAGSQPAEVESR